MVLSLGIDYDQETWRVCLSSDERSRELTTPGDAQAVLAYVKQISASDPEAIIAFSSQFEVPFGPLKAIAESSIPDKDLGRLLHTIGKARCKSFSLPAVRYLPGVPRHRKLKRQHMGASSLLCEVATLLYRMRLRDAAWPEMRFLYLNVAPAAHTILVVKDGYIVDGIDCALVTSVDGAPAEHDVVEQAFWEGLTENLAGLLALHHLEDVVIVGRQSAGSQEARRDAVIEKLDDNYKFYQFPYDADEVPGYEAAIGAALLASGLNAPGLASEVVQRLLASMTLL